MLLRLLFLYVICFHVLFVVCSFYKQLALPKDINTKIEKASNSPQGLGRMRMLIIFYNVSQIFVLKV